MVEALCMEDKHRNDIENPSVEVVPFGQMQDASLPVKAKEPVLVDVLSIEKKLYPALDGPVFLAAGGTGGHVFPAEALAREVISRGVEVHLMTDHRGKTFGETVPEVKVHVVSCMSGSGSFMRKVQAKIALMQGVRQAIKLARQYKPCAVVGFGGYPSVPGALAAARTGTPLIIHDQNALLGRANRFVSRFACAIATSFEHMIGLGDSDPKVNFTGNTVRPQIAALRGASYGIPMPDGPINLLITGGSQGARVFSEVVPEAIALLDEGMRKRLRISQQARAETLEDTRAVYERLGMLGQVELEPFFNDMPERIAKAHLCIGRAGGSTVAEWTAAGRPAIYVPLPIAILDEQTWNARSVERMGGGWIMSQKEFTPSTLAALLKRILNDPQSLAAAAVASHNHGRIDAAQQLANLVFREARKN